MPRYGAGISWLSCCGMQFSDAAKQAKYDLDRISGSSQKRFDRGSNLITAPDDVGAVLWMLDRCRKHLSAEVDEVLSQLLRENPLLAEFLRQADAA